MNVILVSVNFLSSFLPWWRESKHEFTLLTVCQCVSISAIEPFCHFSWNLLCIHVAGRYHKGTSNFIQQLLIQSGSANFRGGSSTGSYSCNDTGVYFATAAQFVVPFSTVTNIMHW